MDGGMSSLEIALSDRRVRKLYGTSLQKKVFPVVADLLHRDGQETPSCCY